MFRNSIFLGLIGLSMLLAGMTHAVESERSGIELSCERGIGGRLCRIMSRIQSSFSYTCSGSACYSLWREQMGYLNDLSSCFDKEVPYRFEADQEMGDLAYEAASEICRSTARGSCQWMRVLYNAKKDGLYSLVEIQKAADRIDIRKCSFSYRCG